MERPDSLTDNDDEYDAYRKRMMLAYRFRPNPLVSLFTKGLLIYTWDYISESTA